MIFFFIDGKFFVFGICLCVVFGVLVLFVWGIMFGLVVVFVGEDLVLVVYVCNKGVQMCEVGMNFYEYKLEVMILQVDLLVLIVWLNCDSDVYGILVQLFLFGYIDSDVVLNVIDLVKDVDGFYVINVGRLVIG